MKNKVGRTIVPTSALKPLIQDWLDRSGYDSRYSLGFNDTEHGFKMGGLDVLSVESGVSIRKLSGIMTGREENVLFDTADRLLCAMQRTSEWHLSLAPYYQDEIETATYERHLVDDQVAA